MRRAALVMALLGALAAGVPAWAMTETIADGTGVTGLSAYGGHLVFSHRDPATKRWRLMAWHAGHIARLPVATRAVAFDADAGPDAQGHPVVVYSVCSTDPRVQSAPDWLKAHGCMLRQLRLDVPQATPQPVPGTDLPGTSATTPSRWRGGVAFARHTDGQFVSSVQWLAAGAASPVVLPGVPVACELDCDDRRVLITIESLDLGARAAAFVSRQEGADTIGIASEWMLRVDPLSGPAKPATLSDGFIDGACGYIYPYTPTVLGVGAFWVAAGSPCSDTQTAFAATDVPSGRRGAGAAPGGGLIFGATRDGSSTYWLRATGRGVGESDPGPLACARVRCRITRTSDLSLRRLGRHDAQGPVPEEG